jgi:hypothetical protein
MVDAPEPDMSPPLEDVVRMHRVESARREAAWMQELEQRRRECAARACVDVAALRAKLAI